jgi:REP element-mobilizing transposase RayT
MRCLARRFAVRVFEYANATNHIHMIVRTKCRIALQNFLRAFAGVSARIATAARRGHASGKFWDWLAYSRVVAWGRDFWGVRAYILRNELEANGQLPYERRARREPNAGARSRASPFTS